MDDKTVSEKEIVNCEHKSTVSSAPTAAPMAAVWAMPQGLASLVKVCKRELANLSSSEHPQTEENQTQRNPEEKTAMLSFHGRLKIFLILLHLLCLKGMTSPVKESSKNSLKTTLLRASTRLSLWNLNSQSILESLIRTARMNLELSINQIFQEVTTSQDSNFILERFLRSVAQETDKDAPNDL